MHDSSTTYGRLCSQFYDATEGYASDKEVIFYASFIEQNPGRVLEAMSGSGRLLIPLIKRGYVVDGVDSSPQMLDRFRERCRTFQLTPQLFEQSLETFSTPHRYATVTIAVGSFQLIHDRAQAVQALKNIRKHMLPNANLLVDTFVPNTSAEPTVTRVARIDTNTVIRLTRRQLFDVAEKRADAFCTYELVVDGSVQTVEQELIQVRWYTDQELEQLFLEAGFKIVTLHEEQFYDAGLSRIVHARPVL